MVQDQEIHERYKALIEAGAAFRARIISMALADPDAIPNSMAMVFGMVECILILKPEAEAMEDWTDKVGELIDEYARHFDPQPGPAPLQ